jgi:hypothetical protein
MTTILGLATHLYPILSNCKCPSYSRGPDLVPADPRLVRVIPTHLQELDQRRPSRSPDLLVRFLLGLGLVADFTQGGLLRAR